MCCWCWSLWSFFPKNTNEILPLFTAHQAYRISKVHKFNIPWLLLNIIVVIQTEGLETFLFHVQQRETGNRNHHTLNKYNNKKTSRSKWSRRKGKKVTSKAEPYVTMISVSFLYSKEREENILYWIQAAVVEYNNSCN